MECYSCVKRTSCMSGCQTKYYNEVHKLEHDPCLLTKYGYMCNCKLCCIECKEYQFYVGILWCGIPIMNCFVCDSCKCCESNKQNVRGVVITPSVPERQDMQLEGK